MHLPPFKELALAAQALIVHNPLFLIELGSKEFPTESKEQLAVFESLKER